MTEQPRTPASQASTGELISQATQDISTLIRNEMQLAKEDLATTGKRVGVGAGLLGFSGSLALYGIGVLLAAAVLGLSLVLDAWLAALIVAAGVFVVAAIIALIGAASLKKAPAPTQERVASVQQDVTAVKDHGKDTA